MDGNGVIHDSDIDRQPRQGKAYTSISLHPESKTIFLTPKPLGGKITPRTQQILDALHKAKAIDDSWHISMSSAGRYENHTWKETDDPHVAKQTSQWAEQESRLTPAIKSITLFHGTSTADWERIQKVGLLSLDKSGTGHSRESRAKHNKNAGVVYLAGDIGVAMRYAESRVEALKKKIRGVGPVVIQVEVPDISRLVSDDDAVNNVARKVSRKLWEKKTPEWKQDFFTRNKPRYYATMFGTLDISDMSVEAIMKEDSLAMDLWRESEEGFNEIMSRLPDRLWEAWLASLRKTDQVGYRGIIPPKFLKRIV